jgi:hypothetical protein
MQLILRALKDYKVVVNNKQPCSVLTEEFKKHEKLDGKKVQFCYSGKMLEESKPIGSFIKEDAVVTVFLRNIPA